MILGSQAAPSLRAYTVKVKPWVAYSLARVGIFAVIFAALLYSGIYPWLSAIIAAVISFCASYLFFGKLRDAVARDIVVRRAKPATNADTEAEDL
ncbi:hypothetical protein GCM10007382_26180 [Salinibacterium xinjiangense]|uniref:DUF4229 domain-containing protein n=1 Tax=Salinibacterium xinjiangense TaxID=386302 RepID=A0A2C9A238_9MICO|nr:hypothetical protein GCM10007382_26180 [Salinibacterium xinjiangense]SOE73017.1 Protein of unknown function [Salinibacterium xinjiangense]